MKNESDQKRLACAYGSHNFHDSCVEGHVECSRCRAVYAKPIGVTQHAGWAGSPAFPPGCRPHDDLTEQTLRDGLLVCVACGSPIGIEQPPSIPPGGSDA